MLVTDVTPSRRRVQLLREQQVWGARTPTALRAEDQDSPMCLFHPCASSTRAPLPPTGSGVHPAPFLRGAVAPRSASAPPRPAVHGGMAPDGGALTARPKPVCNVG